MVSHLALSFVAIALATVLFGCTAKPAPAPKPHWSTLPDEGPDTDASMAEYWEEYRTNPDADPSKFGVGK